MSVVNVEKLGDEGVGFLQVDISELLGDDVLTRRLRMAITRSRKKRETVPVRCGLCKEPIYLRRNYFGGEGYHFCHFRTDDPGLKKCPQRTENHANIELMRCLKYQGAKESQLHYRLKHLIAELLNLDPSVEPGSVKTEKTLSNEGEWRRPDVQAIVNQRLVALEVQVSTEMAEMIVAREHFYETFGSIIWILPAFNPEKINQSQKDILTTNNEHLFVLNQEMQVKSRDTGRVMLEVWINWPRLEDRTIRWEWQRHVAPLSDIAFRKGHAQLLDVDTEETRIRNQLQEMADKEGKLNQEREDARRRNEQHRVALKNERDVWWVGFQDLCEEIVDPIYQRQIRARLASDGNWGKPTSTLSGLWLALHRVYLQNCECSPFVVKALLCASKGQLDYGYSSWKYIAKGLINAHPEWFSPFYKLCKESIRISELSKLRADPQVADTIELRKQNPIILNDEQRTLFELIAPTTEVKALPYNLIALEEPGFIFPYNRQPEGSGERTHASPPDLNMVHFHMDLERHRHLLSGAPPNDIASVLMHLQDQRQFIPFPCIPVANANKRYVMSREACDEILPSWNRQLEKLEKDLESCSVLVR